MPVVTRSQSKIQHQLNVTSSISESNIILDNRSTNHKYFIEIMKIKLNDIHTSIKFEQYRMITEMLFTIREWFNLVINVNGVISYSWKEFINKVYLKTNELLAEVYEKKTTSFTYEENCIFKTMINELRETRKFLKPYLTNN